MLEGVDLSGKRAIVTGAEVTLAVGATRRWGESGILANSLMPGGIWTNLQRHWSAEFLSPQEEYARQNGISIKSPE